MPISSIPEKRLKAKALLVDLDDTIIFGDKKEVLERLAATAQSLSLGIGRDKLREICEHRSCMIEMIAEIVKDENISRERFEQEKEKFDGKFDDLLFLGEGVADTLSYLKSLDIPMAIVSTRTSSAIPRILEKNGILKYFSVIIGRSEYKEKKPSPEPFECALGRLGIQDKKDIYMIGDSQAEDIQGAINAGIGSILVGEKFDSQKALPTLRIKGFKDLRKLLT